MVDAGYRAALAAGRRAYHAGEDIERAVTLAGFSAGIARGVYEYFTRVPELQQQSQSQGLDQDMAPSYKRGRYYNAYRAGVKAKPKVAPTVKKYVKRCMDRIVETKYVEGSLSFTNPTSAGAIAGNFLSGIQLGTSDTSRVGNNIRVKNIWLKGYWSDANNAVLRLLLAWDRQPNGAVPAVTDIITANGTNSGYNHDTVVGQGGQRFTVITDRRQTLNLGYSVALS